LKGAIEVRRLLATLALSTSAIAVKPAATVADGAVLAIDASDLSFSPNKITLHGRYADDRRLESRKTYVDSPRRNPAWTLCNWLAAVA
jgi:hypothetical protein